MTQHLISKFYTYIIQKYIKFSLTKREYTNQGIFLVRSDYLVKGNTGLEEAQAGIKTSRRNINNLRYADDTTLMAESEEEPLDESEREEQKKLV